MYPDVLVSAGTVISSAISAAINTSDSVGVLTNQGTISSSLTSGVLISTNGNVTEIDNTNTGLISGNSAGIHNDGIISLLNNAGTILAQTSYAIYNGGSIGALTNSGTIQDNITGIYNSHGTITTLDNSGTIIGTLDAGIKNVGGFITTLTNSGTISGANAIYNFSSGNISTISTLINSISGVILGSSNALNNAGVITLLDNSGLMSGTVNGITSNGTISTLNNAGTISGGTTGISNLGLISTLTNSIAGTISGASAISNNYGGRIGALTNSGDIQGTSLGISNAQGTITSLSNDGTISASAAGGTAIKNTGTIHTLTNDGVVSGTYGIINTLTGIIDTLTNSINGTISAVNTGIYNRGSIGSLRNDGTISASTSLSSANGIYNAGSITSFTNTGLINAYFGVGNSSNGSITSFTNSSSGIITGAYSGLYNNGTIGTLSNAGTIYGSTFGIATQGRTSLLDNSGTIQGGYGAIVLSTGTIGTLNNSGLITAPIYAIGISASGAIDNFINTGTIAGPISNLSSAALSITGGTGTIFGTLTGVNGSIGNLSSAAGLVFVSGNQLLNDNVTAGTVTNTGAVLQVNNHITITGNYDQAAAATLLLGVSDAAVTNGVSVDTGYGRLVVTGAATIASGSSVMLQKTNTYAFAAGQRYVVVQASSSGTNYNASTLNYSAVGTTYTVTGAQVTDGAYDDLVLTIAGTSTDSGSGSGSGSSNNASGVSNAATTSNASTVLNALFNYGGVNQSLLNVFNPAAALTSSGAANKAGAQLSPAAVNGATSSGVTAAFTAVQNAAAGRVDAQRVAQAGGSGVATGESSYAPVLWGRAFGGAANQSERDSISGYHANFAGLLIGGDALVTPDWRAGAVFSYARTNVGNDGDNTGTSAHVDAYGLTAYAGYDGKPWFVDLTAGVSRQQYSTTRVISYTGFDGVANGSFKGTLYSASARAGYPLAMAAGTTLTPLLELAYTSLRQDGYTETNGNGAALVVNGTGTNSLKSALGAKLDRAFATSYGLLTPSLQLSWLHELHDSRLNTSASFAADSSGATAFTTYGASTIRDTAQLQLGLMLLQSKNLTVAARYTLEGASGYTSQTGDLTLRWQY